MHGKSTLMIFMILLLVLAGCAELHWKKIKKINTRSSYESFIRRHPTGPLSTQAQAELKTCAKIASSIPKTIPYRRWGSDGWLYKYTITFTESQGVVATVEWVKRIYRDRKDRSGLKYWSSNSNGHSENIRIRANGSNTYSSWIRGDVSPDLRGGTVVVLYSGHDVNGHPFSGRVASKLAWPKQ